MASNTMNDKCRECRENLKKKLVKKLTNAAASKMPSSTGFAQLMVNFKLSFLLFLAVCT
jgi:hypothetical protein